MDIIFPYILQKEYLYNHTTSNDEIFVFPITGFSVNGESEVTIGKSTFVNVANFSFDRYRIYQAKKNWLENSFKKVTTLAVVDVKGLSDEWYSQNDNTAIALQLLKQSIGAIYVSRYNFSSRIDDEKRIVISNLGFHEVDEGLTPFFSENNCFNVRNVSDTLMLNNSQGFGQKLGEISDILMRYYSSKNELNLKVLKCFELLYCLYNEIYSNERILKICSFLNFLFIEDEFDNIGSPEIVSRSIQLLNHYKINVYSRIPSDLCNISHLPKLQKYLRDIYENIRNKFSHGKINFYREFTVISTVDYLVYKIVIMELINLLLFNSDLESITTSKGLNHKIQEIKKQYAAIKSKGVYCD